MVVGERPGQADSLLTFLTKKKELKREIVANANNKQILRRTFEGIVEGAIALDVLEHGIDEYRFPGDGIRQ